MSTPAVEELLGTFDRVMAVAKRGSDRIREVPDAPGRLQAQTRLADQVFTEVWQEAGFGRLLPKLAWDRREITDRRDDAYTGMVLVEFLKTKFGECLRCRVEEIDRRFLFTPNVSLLFEGVIAILAPREEVEKFRDEAQRRARESLHSWACVAEARQAWRDSFWGSFDHWFRSQDVQERLKIAIAVALRAGLGIPNDADLKRLVYERVVDWAGPGEKVSKGATKGAPRTADGALDPFFLRDMLRVKGRAEGDGVLDEATPISDDDGETGAELSKDARKDGPPEPNPAEAVARNEDLLRLKKKLHDECEDDRDREILKLYLAGLTDTEIANKLGVHRTTVVKRRGELVSRAGGSA